MSQIPPDGRWKYFIWVILGITLLIIYPKHKLELKIEANFVAFSNQHVFFHGKSFIRIIAQIKHINQKRFPLCLLICVFKFPASLFDFSPVCFFMCVLKLLARDDAKSHWLHLFDFSPLCVFKCLLKLLGSEKAKSHWLHLFYFSPLCVFKCVLKALACKDVKSHWLHVLDFSPSCVFKCVLRAHA